jgi:hypothetical protein
LPDAFCGQVPLYRLNSGHVLFGEQLVAPALDVQGESVEPDLMRPQPFHEATRPGVAQALGGFENGEEGRRHLNFGLMLSVVFDASTRRNVRCLAHMFPNLTPARPPNNA